MYGLDVGQQLGIGQLNIGVLEAGHSHYFFPPPQVNPVSITRGVLLSGKAVDHRFHRVGLVGLDFEFQFHGSIPSNSAAISLGEGNWPFNALGRVLVIS